MRDKQGKELAVSVASDTGGAIAGGLIGMAIGGPPGALIGAAAGPPVSAAIRLASAAARRRLDRAGEIVQEAADFADQPLEAFEHAIESDPDRLDIFITALGDALNGNPALQGIYSPILGQLALSKSELEKDRLRLLLNALRNIERTQIRIVMLLAVSERPMTPSEIAKGVSIPEQELRGAVRELELKGIIKDIGEAPKVSWQLRELGKLIADAVRKSTENQ